MSEVTPGRIQETLAVYLANQIGREAIAEFQCGQEEIVRKAGVLKEVQSDFFILRDDMNLRDVVCSMEHLCFITFYLAGTMPGQPDNRLNEATNTANTNVQPASSTGRTLGGAALHTIRKGRKPD